MFVPLPPKFVSKMTAAWVFMCESQRSSWVKQLMALPLLPTNLIHSVFYELSPSVLEINVIDAMWAFYLHILYWRRRMSEMPHKNWVKICNIFWALSHHNSVLRSIDFSGIFRFAWEFRRIWSILAFQTYSRNLNVFWSILAFQILFS